MKAMKLIILAGLFVAANARANDIETAYARFDELRASNAPAAEKAYGAFEYFSIISRVDAKPASYEGCLKSIRVGVRTSDPCAPVSARLVDSGGGSTGGVD